MIKCPYEENRHLIDSDFNLPIRELRNLGENAFRDWAVNFRKEVVYAWDVLGVPIVDGKDEDGIIEDFTNLYHYDVSKLERMDELTGEKDCIANVSTLGACCNQFFPTMLKTEDVSETKLRGKSIYGYFADEEKLDKFVDLISKLFRADPFSYFSKAHEVTSEELISKLINKEFENEIWFVAKKRKQSRAGVTSLADVLKLRDLGLIQGDQVIGDGDSYEVREYVSDSLTIMDVARVFRVAFDIRPATNFPPVIAKYLYTHFTKDLEQQDQVIVYDPSAGWGGRILSAMSAAMDRRIHYVGTDPNTDHLMNGEGKTKYEYLADYFNREVQGRQKNSFEIFTLGSEEIHKDDGFQKYKERVDFIFTSPPYFAAEGYSQDETQSSIKFPTYEGWRDHFLKQTLQTCVEWLKPGRWMCWNIADVTLGSNTLPLQDACIEILTDLGMEYRGFKKMVLAKSPGGDKQTDVGVPTTKNFCKVNGIIKKYEPIYMFWKPHTEESRPATIPDLATIANSRYGHM